MGRPSKLTPETQSKLIQAIRGGSFLVVACEFAGVSYKVFRDWMIRGETEGKGQFREFRNAVIKAESEVEVRLTASWQKATADDWRAAAEFLSRRFPDRWSSTQKLQVQLEAELNAIYDKIENDPTIPLEYKKAVFAAIAASSQD